MEMEHKAFKLVENLTHLVDKSALGTKQAIPKDILSPLSDDEVDSGLINLIGPVK